MKLLEERIIKDGIVKGKDILKVDSFLNHQIDVHLLGEMGKEFKRIFDGCGINKILTIESSGIGIACMTAQVFDVPVVFAKKGKSLNIDEVYTSKVESFTHGKVYDVMVDKKYLNSDDNVLIIDDFLANGKALIGLSEIVKMSGAHLAGVGIAIEKGFQPGGRIIRDMGIRVESLAIIESMDENDGIVFRN